MQPVPSNTLQKSSQQRWLVKFRCSVLLSCLALAVLASGQAVATPLPVLPQAPNLNNRLLAITPDPIVQEMIDQVQSSALYDYVAGLSGAQAVTIGRAAFTLVTRNTGAPTYIEKATQYAYERFQALGLAVEYHAYTYYGGPRRNVVADQPGTDPECLYLITAHLDDTSTQPTTLAPGADDNASGSTGVLVAAEILSKYQFTCSLRYVLFTGEEQGLLGSHAYAQMAAGRDDPILGVLNLDMIAYNTPNTDATIELDIRSGTAGYLDQVLANMVEDVIEAYQIDLIPLVYPSDETGSDHYSFWQVGYPAMLLIEDWGDHTPYYHKVTDTVGTLNMPYFTEFVKASVGALAHLGQVEPIPSLDYHLYAPLTSR